MTDITPKSEQITEFITSIKRLTHRSSDTKTTAPTLGLAISGGPDSMALLWLMQSSYEGPIIAATIDHGLRKESAQEALHVAAICEKLGIKHAILAPKHPITGNIQSNARKTRYALLEQWAQETGCHYIVTAHHADDQLETMIMRLNRASGIAGLAAIRECNGNIIRPLLGFRKSDLIEICEDARIDYIDDPSNHNDDFDRVQVRQLLKQCAIYGLEPIINPAMAQRSAKHLDDANIALEYSAALLAKQKISAQANSIVLDVIDLPREYQRRLLIRALQQINPKIEPRGTNLDKAIKSLNNNIIAMIGDIKITPRHNHKDMDKTKWILSKAPDRRHR